MNQYSFPRYLLSKQSVDDRALNQHVLQTLRENLPRRPLRVIEIGGGIGAMIRRLLRWNILQNADYILVDEMRENIEAAEALIPQWAAEQNLRVERSAEQTLRAFDSEREIRIQLHRADIFQFIQERPQPADLLIAHAVLDLLPMPESMAKILTLTKDLAWLTINFDGVTSLEPTIDAALDENIERLYHATMDARASGGDSRAGRHLFSHLRGAGAEILAAGASDWAVHALNGAYPADEKYFLHFILHFFEESLAGNARLNADDFSAWTEKRRAQIERGELTYIAHQMDFLARVKFPNP
ncbi:MAG: class I SAM-dependent methyltransferase [Anaerolineales bacterium]